MGYCHICCKLVPIAPGAQKLGTRECAWRPLPHDDASGAPCQGDRRELVGAGPVFRADPIELLSAPIAVDEEDLS
jgi:hypothetical protein